MIHAFFSPLVLAVFVSIFIQIQNANRVYRAYSSTWEDKIVPKSYENGECSILINPQFNINSIIFRIKIVAGAIYFLQNHR